MPLTNSLIELLKTNFPQFTFKKSTNFSWSPNKKTIYYNDDDSNFQIILMHELSHGLLNHADYAKDIELIAMERDAWDKAISLCAEYGIKNNDQIVQSTMNTYRDWLHERSVCPKCSANGLQNEKNKYKCIACGNIWRVNEARSCALRRYQLKNK